MLFHNLSIRIMIVILLALPPLLSSGCSQKEQADTLTITVAAASSLQQVFTELSAEFSKLSDIEVTLVFGSTGQLSQQLEQGAPYDLIATADEQSMDLLIQKGIVTSESKAIFGEGRIGFLHAKDLIVEANVDLLLQPSIKRIAIANPEVAPYGRAAKESLLHAGLWEQVQDKIVIAQNISQVQQFVETSNADIGIVALSLQTQSDLEFTLIDEATHQPIIQAIGIPSQSKQYKLAEQFIQFLLSTQGQELLDQYGYQFPEKY